MAPYLRALDERAVGEVAARAYGEPTRSSSPPVPYDAVSVLLLPYSTELEAQVDAIKAHLRDSLEKYAEASAQLAAARTAYEHRLLAAGGGELIRGEVSDAGGLLRFAEVPAGEWLLWAWREEWHPARTAKPRREEAGRFLELPVTAGRSTVSYWLMRLTVRPGETTSVNINDRNVWLVGVREDLRIPEPSSATRPQKRR